MNWKGHERKSDWSRLLTCHLPEGTGGKHEQNTRCTDGEWNLGRYE